MIQTIIVIMILLVAVYFAISGFAKSIIKANKGDGCDCSSCGSKSSCHKSKD